MQATQLEKAIHTTVQYFDVLDMPVTATQIWWCMVGGFQEQERWSLREVQETIRTSQWLQERLETTWGYIYVKGRKSLVQTRLRRHRAAQQKWKIAKRAAKALACVPFVKALAGSGSLAIDNTKPTSDLDFFVITTSNRIWTARLLLLGVSQLLGRRRKYWDTHAPDMLCLNHYVSRSGLGLSASLHNAYTAALYALLVPVYGAKTIQEFQQENAVWMNRYVVLPPQALTEHQYAVHISFGMRLCKQLIEGLLLEPIGDAVEKFAERIQRRLIVKHTTGQGGRVALSAQELAFHPDTKAPFLLEEFQRRIT